MKSNRGAIRSVLGSVATAATVIETALTIAQINLDLMLEEEKLEAEKSLAQIEAERAKLLNKKQ